MEFKEAVKILDTILSKKDPPSFNSSWILKNAPKVYRFSFGNIRTENGDIDWDKITRSLDHRFWKRWQHPRKRPKQYWDKKEVHKVLKSYKDKPYTFITCLNEATETLAEAAERRSVRLDQPEPGPISINKARLYYYIGARIMEAGKIIS